MSKNIETCKSEEVLSSVLDQQPQDYCSVQQAVHDLGVTALPAASAADPDIEELPSNVEVFVRRVLKAVVYDRVLPVVQQMWQAVLNRISSPNYTPYSLYPYASNPSLRTLGTLPTALTAISSRKISNGGATNDGIPDGVSLAHLLMASNDVTKIADDNVYAITKAFPLTLFPDVEQFTFADGTTVATSSAIISGYTKPTLTVYGLSTVTNDAGFALFSGSFTKLYSYIKKIDGTAIIVNQASIEEIYLPELESANCIITWAESGWWNNVSPNFNKLYAPKLKKITSNYGTGSNAYAYKSCLIGAQCPSLTKLELPALEELEGVLMGGSCCPNLEELRMPNLKRVSGSFVHGTYQTSKTALQLLEVGAMETNLNLDWWNPTDKGTAFLENFLHHIAERLAVGPTTNRLTLTLSADVYSACGFGATIDDTTDIRYQIKKAIQDRNWKVTDGTNNFNQ